MEYGGIGIGSTIRVGLGRKNYPVFNQYLEPFLPLQEMQIFIIHNFIQILLPEKYFFVVRQLFHNHELTQLKRLGNNLILQT